jgi:hypothetical protein
MALLQANAQSTGLPTSGAGLDISTAALTPLGANTGVQFLNNGRQHLIVNNGSGVGVNVTPKIQRPTEGVTPSFTPYSLPAGKTQVFGPYSQADFNDGNGMVEVDIAPQASVAVMVVVPSVASN